MSPPCVGNKRVHLWIAGAPDETSMCPRESEGECSVRARKRRFIGELARWPEKEDAGKRGREREKGRAPKRKRDRERG